MNRTIDHLLSSLDIQPVLVDIGSSYGTPEIWEEIAHHSVYVGFDPDARELREIQQGHFKKTIIVNKAVTSGKNDTVAFYLTTFPGCSSTLGPDHKSLSNYLYSNLFTVEKQTKVQATSLNAAIDSLSLSGIDWFKTDSQGTDLRLFNSLSDERRSRVLAVDIEPGLIDAYIGEDLYVDAHRELTRNGFWLSDLNVCGAVRMRRISLQVVKTIDSRIDDEFINKTVKQSPSCCEARYFRTIEWLTQHNRDKRDHVLLWIFAILDKQLGFAVDLGIAYEEAFGKDEVSRVMKEEPCRAMQRYRRMLKQAAARNFPFQIARRILRLFKKP